MITVMAINHLLELMTGNCFKQLLENAVYDVSCLFFWCSK